jgi:hypothetical protein
MSVWMIATFGYVTKLEIKQSITNTLALPIDKMMYIYLLCQVHTLNTKKIPFQSKQSKHFHQRNQLL